MKAPWLDGEPRSFSFPHEDNVEMDRTLVSYDEMTRSRRSWPWWRWGVTALSVLGLALSAYLSWHYLAGALMIGCGGGSACEEVLNSRWSSIGGILPVSGLAAGAYLAMLVASFSVSPTVAAAERRLAWSAILILASAAAGSAIWFVIVQKWFIGQFCPYCMATHVTSLLLATLVVWHAPRQLGPAAGQRRTTVMATVGVAVAGVMAFCQVHFVPPAVYREGQSQMNLTTADSLAGPMVGSADAPYVVALMFDYKCPHCQQLHFMLGEAIRRYHGKLAFALCPAPLNTTCNPYVPQNVERFSDSCEFAKIGLAVWLAKRAAFPAFELWMFSLESGDRWQPRSLEAVKAKAIELVGQAKFDAALADPWVNRYLQTSVRIYGNSGGGAIPKLVFGSRWTVPQPNDVNDLLAILQKSLGLPKP